jgi:hypothetical protein
MQVAADLRVLLQRLKCCLRTGQPYLIERVAPAMFDINTKPYISYFQCSYSQIFSQVIMLV